MKDARMLRPMLIQCAGLAIAIAGGFVLLYVLPISNSGIEFRLLVLASGMAALIVPWLVSYLFRTRAPSLMRPWITYGIVFTVINLVVWSVIVLLALRVALTWAA